MIVKILFSFHGLESQVSRTLPRTDRNAAPDALFDLRVNSLLACQTASLRVK